MGVCFTIDSGKPPADSNLGVIDLDVGLRPPLGVAVLVDSSYVSGGGLLFHDAAQHLYAGALVLTLRGGMSLKAVGLVATRAPDGSKAFSMLLFITAEGFQPIPIGLGFTLRGIGGMLAIHRTFDEVAMKASLASGTLKNVLFPKDLVHRVSEVLTSLTTLFPARRGCFIFGPIVKIDWGTPAMIDIELAVLYEIRLNRGDRLIILGRLSSILPNRDRDLVRLNIDAFGLIDFEQGTAAVDAVLVIRASSTFRADRADGDAAGVEGRRQLRARGRRPAPGVRAAGGLPATRSHRAGAHHRRQPAPHLPGVFRAHAEHGTVRRHGIPSTLPRSASASRARSASTC